MRELKMAGLAMVTAFCVIGNIEIIGSLITALANARSDMAVAAAFLLLVLLVLCDAVVATLLWTRLRMYLMPGALLVAVLALTGCYKTIEPGRAGITVEQTGANKGVGQIPVQTGRVFYNPFNEYVLEYPTSVQRAIWTQSAGEGHPDNEEIAFQSSDQLHFTVDVAVAYQLVYEHVPAFYVQFRNDDIAAFTHGFFRDAVRKSVGLAAQHYSQEEINGGKQADLEHEAQESLAKFMDPYGVRIIQLAFTAPPRAPETVKGAIEQKIAATQRAEQIENEKRQAVAEGQKTIATAEAAAKANALITASINPTLIQWEQMKVMREKWDGRLPTVQSGSGSTGMLLSMPSAPR